MFCKKCGKELPDESKFCSACGEYLESAMPAKTNTSLHSWETNKNILLLRIMSIVCSIIILILLFADWISIRIPELFTTTTCSTMALFNLEEYFLNIGVLEENITLVPVILMLSELAIGIFIIAYLISEFTSKPNYACVEQGYIAMGVTIIALIICFFTFWMFNATEEYYISISFTNSPYIIFALAILNDLFLLPKYQKMCQDNPDPSKIAKQEQRKARHDAEVLQSGGWKCNFCGKVNPQYTGTCSCGNTKYENKSVVE